MIQTAFAEGRLLTGCMCQTVVLVPKGNGKFREIGIVVIICKALLGVINWRIGAEVKFNYVLNGF